MNRAEKRRQKKLAEKSAKKLKPAKSENNFLKNRALTLEQAHAVKRALQHHAEGQLPQAERIYQTILQTDPDQPVALHLLGVIASQRGDNDLAVDLITKAVAVKPDYGEAYNDLGNAFKELGRLDEAVSSYNKALTSKADYAEAHVGLGVVLRDLGKLDEAVTSYHSALAVNPDYAEAHYSLGNVYKDLGRLDEAVASQRKALALKPDYADAQNNLGLALRDLGKLDEAIDSFRKAVAIRPNYAEAHSNLGISLKDQGKLNEAVTCYQKSIARNPEYAEAHLNLALLLFLRGNLKESWKEYEWRSKINNSGTRILPIEMWPGSSLHGKNIVIYAEQGVGDEIMFASCIPDLLEQSPNKLFLECDPRLEALFARSFPGVQVHGKLKDMDFSWLGDNAQPDYALPIGSLPQFFRNRTGDFPERDAYLTPQPDLVEKWEQRLSGLKAGLKIGISWRGGTVASTIKRASIPLSEWQPLLSMNASFINLQYGDVSEEIAMLGGLQIHDWQDNDPRTDLDNQAALISCLDLVITIDNATVHMCGALGTKTWALIEQVPDWRWPEVFGDCPPLYRSVRLFRQKRLFEWGDVMEQVARSLKDLIETEQPPKN